MALRSTLRHMGRLVRKVTVSDDETIVLDEAIGPWMPVLVSPPPEPGDEDDIPPRQRPKGVLRFAEGFKGLGAGGAGDRVELATLTPGSELKPWVFPVPNPIAPVLDSQVELLGPLKPLAESGLVAGYEVQVQLVKKLWHVEGALHNQDGTVVLASARLALWGRSENQQQRGRYESISGEVPLELRDLVDVNKNFVIGGRKHNISEVRVDSGARRVSMTVRKPGG